MIVSTPVSYLIILIIDVKIVKCLIVKKKKKKT